jgi:hypothetical protein
MMVLGRLDRSCANLALKLSENPHELANLLAIRRLIATYMKASELSGRRS